MLEDIYREMPKITKYITEQQASLETNKKLFEIYNKNRMKGKNNPAYINGSSYNKRSYRGDNWEYIRKQIYQRDNWTCKLCLKHCQKKNH